MRISGRQRKALEKITGKHWDTWHPDAVRAYFSFTDKGQSVPVLVEAQDDLNELMSQHRWHTVIVEMWKEDFQKGLLFLDDFKGYPKAYVKHALEVYCSVFNYIPMCYKQKVKEEK